MTWSFDDTSTSNLNVVRAYFGDVSSNFPILSDEQVNNAISKQNATIEAGLLFAASTCAEMCAAKFAIKVDHSGEGLTASRSQLFTHFTDLCDKLKEKAEALIATGGGASKTEGPSPLVGGVSTSDNDDMEADTDFIQPIYSRDQFSNTTSGA